MLYNDNGATVFVHPKNITVGKGRVLWAGGTTDASGVAHAPGWVLPGGIRTLDEVAAHAAALALNTMLAGA